MGVRNRNNIRLLSRNVRSSIIEENLDALNEDTTMEEILQELGNIEPEEHEYASTALPVINLYSNSKEKEYFDEQILEKIPEDRLGFDKILLEELFKSGIKNKL